MIRRPPGTMRTAHDFPYKTPVRSNLDLRRPPGGRTTVFGRTGLRPRLLCTPGGFGARGGVMHAILRPRPPAMRGRPSPIRTRLASEPSLTLRSLHARVLLALSHHIERPSRRATVCPYLYDPVGAL